MNYDDADDLRKYRADIAEDAEDTPVPPCPGAALPALADQPVRRCTKELGHKGACADDAGELLGEDAEPLPQREPGAALGCSAVSPHGDACTLARDHGGMHETHWLGERTASWTDDPDDIDRCNKRMGVTRGHRCERTKGHTGVHSFDGGPLNNEEALLRELFDGVPSAPSRSINDQRRRDGLPPLDLRMGPLTAQPVRVRFVDLPHRHTEARGPFGNKLHIAEPGGFALVVDRFKHLAHLEAEREMWTAWADLIGAAAVLCYPGELDVVGWLDNA